MFKAIIKKLNGTREGLGSVKRCKKKTFVKFLSSVLLFTLATQGHYIWIFKKYPAFILTVKEKSHKEILRVHNKAQLGIHNVYWPRLQTFFILKIYYRRNCTQNLASS